MDFITRFCKDHAALQEAVLCSLAPGSFALLFRLLLVRNNHRTRRDTNENCEEQTMKWLQDRYEAIAGKP